MPVDPYPIGRLIDDRPSVDLSSAVKVATPDIILFDNDSLSIESMTDLIFEDIGGQELINIARTDTVNGASVSYQPIKNLSALSQKFGSQNIVPIQDTSFSYFKNFPFRLENYVPEPDEGSGPNGESVYIDSNGDLIIDIINVVRDEQVEIQILNSGEVIDDTIY